MRGPADFYERLWGRGVLTDAMERGADRFAAVLDGTVSRVPGPAGPERIEQLAEQYARLDEASAPEPGALAAAMAEDFFAGAVNWRSPSAQHNIGSAVNAASAAVQALSLAVNVNLINNDQGGNAVAAEQAIARILASLIEADPRSVRALFTFGGTGTLLYGIKAGIRRADPASARHGTSDRIAVFAVEGGHFSAARASEWLGIGSERFHRLPVDREGRADLERAERHLQAALDSGLRIGAIVANGGTTFGHHIDDLAGLAALRDRLVDRNGLEYRPLLHVDAVIGWPWLLFKDADAGEYTEDPAVAAALREQHRRISALRHADTWGVDFHKGPGCAPLDSSCTVFNDASDLEALAGGIDTYPVGPDGMVSDIAYTLETAREAGKAVGALAALHSLGRDGVRRLLAALVESAFDLRRTIAARPDWTVLDPENLGYQTLLRPLAPDADPERPDGTAEEIREGNRYVEAFYAWDESTRMRAGEGLLYSLAPRCARTAEGEPLTALKFYPVSPLTGRDSATEAAETLIKRKDEFDARH